MSPPSAQVPDSDGDTGLPPFSPPSVRCRRCPRPPDCRISLDSCNCAKGERPDARRQRMEGLKSRRAPGRLSGIFLEARPRNGAQQSRNIAEETPLEPRSPGNRKTWCAAFESRVPAGPAEGRCRNSTGKPNFNSSLACPAAGIRQPAGARCRCRRWPGRVNEPARVGRTDSMADGMTLPLPIPGAILGAIAGSQLGDARELAMSLSAAGGVAGFLAAVGLRGFLPPSGCGVCDRRRPAAGRGGSGTCRKGGSSNGAAGSSSDGTRTLADSCAMTGPPISSRSRQRARARAQAPSCPTCPPSTGRPSSSIRRAKTSGRPHGSVQCSARRRRWIPSGFPGRQPGVSTRWTASTSVPTTAPKTRPRWPTRRWRTIPETGKRRTGTARRAP